MTALSFSMPVAAGLAVALRAEAACVIEQLARVPVARDEAIHEARRAIRRVRAILVLARPVAGTAAVRVWSQPWREAGCALSTLRDADSSLKAIRQLQQGPASELDCEALAWLAAAARRRLARTARAEAGAVARAEALVQAAVDELPQWDGFDTDALVAGLARGYRVGRRRLRAARRAALDEVTHDEECWHALRRAARTHWLQMELVVKAWPQVLKAQARQARRLSQLLGAERDLAMVDALAARKRGVDAQAERVRALRPRLAALRARAREDALHRARRQFDEQPRAFARRIDGLVRLALERGGLPAPRQSAR